MFIYVYKMQFYYKWGDIFKNHIQINFDKIFENYKV